MEFHKQSVIKLCGHQLYLLIRCQEESQKPWHTWHVCQVCKGDFSFFHRALLISNIFNGHCQLYIYFVTDTSLKFPNFSQKLLKRKHKRILTPQSCPPGAQLNDGINASVDANLCIQAACRAAKSCVI